MARAIASRFFTSLMLGVLLLGQISCDASSPESASSEEDTAATNSQAEPRIVSLTPAITQILIDMGKRDQIVGVAEHDDPSLNLPVCGNFRQPMTARIVELKPDIVLTESPGGEMSDAAKVLQAVADKVPFELKVIPHSRSIADVQRALVDPEAGVGAAVGDMASAKRARDLMELRIDLIRTVLEDVDRPRVLMLINPTTLGAIGTGVTLDEMLQLAGGTNALAHVNTGYLTVDRAQLQQTIRPDIVLILEPGGSELEDGDARLRPLEGLTIPAVMNRRFAVINHPKAMLPSTSLPEVMLEMALVLHPEKAATIRDAYDTAEVIINQADESQPDGDGP